MKKEIGIIGLGNVGSMLLSKIIEFNIYEENHIYVANRSKEKIDRALEQYPKLNVCENNKELAKKCKDIIICVEPLNLPAVMAEIKPYLSTETYLMISTTMVASKDLLKIHNGNITIFMPTLISLVNSGVTLVYHSDNVTDRDKNIFENILDKISEVVDLDEEDINITQNLTASFPGIFAEIMLEFVKSTLKYSSNVTHEKLEKMLLISINGASKLLIDKNMSFEETIDRVSTKGGITYEGVKVCKEKLPIVFDETIEATVNRYNAIVAEAGSMIDNLIEEDR
ncbi:MAG: NAD(P)-binding domain-containing protein [Tissierellia bacterium]|nr:NAD(P)-binding domain-containing protein [Tissierellia bacterium]